MRPYSRPIAPIASTSQSASTAFDLRLPPLPHDDDDDLKDPVAVAHARGLKPAKKVAGVRHKVKDPKGKKRRQDSDSDNESDAPTSKRRGGRPSGSGNYSKEDMKCLLDALQDELPLGPKGWNVVAGKYKRWAVKHGRPERGQKSLETKFKQFLKVKKPTGDAVCPPEIKRAHQIEELMNQRAGTRDLNDSDFDDDAKNASSDDEIEIVDAPVRTAIARRVPTPPLRRNSRLNAPEVLNQLSRAFDPDVQRARDDERSQRSLQNTQLLAVNQQLRDALATNESLRSQITSMQGHINDVERARDRAELRLEMRDGPGMGRESRRRSPSAVREKPRKKIRCERHYRDGGRATYWITGSSGSDSEKENEHPSSDPLPSSSSSRPAVLPLPRPRTRSDVYPGSSPYPSSSPSHGGNLIAPITDGVVGDDVDFMEFTMTPRRGGRPLSVVVATPVPKNTADTDN
ncbi:hypothetical protein B0H15DRAFT_777358 [Mycena belliarum]|uniref:DUF6818 domain-containing protein n=1 Tax=Mycena belliarum TaxID=1033014 RepID=A0AAD6U715_9AGAR|nr:hypothetical protein B0H15DRAFT_777358 [Mycena belliae]